MIVEGKICSCGKIHTCGIQTVIVQKGAIARLADYAAAYRRIVVVADQNTDAVCGARVRRQIEGKVANTLVFQRPGVLVPDERAVNELENAIPPGAELLLAVGSGVIQDLCKFVAFRKRLPYAVVATAPSMDGYASSGAALIAGGMKITCPARVPEAIFADTDLLREAPMDLIRAGYGDILGKFSCLNDWKLSAFVNGEYYCKAVCDEMADRVKRVQDLGAKLLKRDGEAIAELMRALIDAGVFMAYVGSSRPASGSEHHLSHFFEIVGLDRGEPYFPHGIDVAYSTVVTQTLREELLAHTPEFGPDPFDPAAWEREIRRVYGRAANGVIALQKRLGWHDRDRVPEYRAKWPRIRGILQETPSARELEDCLARVGLEMRAFEELYSEEKRKDAIRCAMDLKERYSVLWLYHALRP